MSVCPRCGAVFDCGMVDASASEAPCWCMLMPTLPAGAYAPATDDAASSRCFCPECLRARRAAAAPPTPEKSSG